MYLCPKCGHTSITALDRCPQCGVWFSGVQCQSCRYVGSKNEFASRGDRCPKCNSVVHYAPGAAPAQPLSTPGRDTGADFSRFAGYCGLIKGKPRFPALLGMPVALLLAQYLILSIHFGKIAPPYYYPLIYPVSLGLFLLLGCFLVENRLPTRSLFQKIMTTALLVGFAQTMVRLLLFGILSSKNASFSFAITALRPFVHWTAAVALFLFILSKAKLHFLSLCLGYLAMVITSVLVGSLFYGRLNLNYGGMLMAFVPGSLLFAAVLYAILRASSKESLE